MRNIGMAQSACTLVPILGDQLSNGLASLRGCDKAETIILMMEVWDEATYVKHHKQKITLIFSAMRHFAEEMRAAGWTVDYVHLDAPDNSGSLFFLFFFSKILLFSRKRPPETWENQWLCA